MRILALNDERVSGGAAQLFRRTNEILQRAGHDVVEVTGEDLIPFAQRSRPPLAESTHRYAPGGRLARLAWNELRTNVRQVYAPRLIHHLERLLQQAPVDVAHVHNLHQRLSTHVLPFLKQRGVPIVYQVNDYFFFCNTHWAYNPATRQPCKRCIKGNVLWAIRYGCVERLGKPRFDRALLQGIKRAVLVWTKPWAHASLFLVTSDQASQVLEEWGVPPAKQFRMLNPMLMEEFRVPTRIGDEIIFYGTCLSTKGTDVFLNALQYVDPTCRLGVYLMDMTPEYMAQLQSLGAQRGLHLAIDPALRWNNGLRERVASARAVVVPSQWWVTSENVVYEAQLFGKPIIATHGGGNAELVDHGETGFLVEPRDTEGLARYINLLSSDRALAERLGHTARARARHRFAEPAFLGNLESAYQQAIALHATGRPVSHLKTEAAHSS